MYTFWITGTTASSRGNSEEYLVQIVVLFWAILSAITIHYLYLYLSIYLYQLCPQKMNEEDMYNDLI